MTEQKDIEYIVNFMKDLIVRNPQCKRENFQLDAMRLITLSEDDKFELYNASNMKTRPVILSLELVQAVDTKIHNDLGKCERFGCGGPYMIKDFKNATTTSFRAEDTVTNGVVTGIARDVGLFTFKLCVK